MATTAAIIGEKLPQGAGEDSYNVLPALLCDTAGKAIHDVTIHHSGGGVFAIRVGDWKLIWESDEAGYDNGPQPGSPGQLYNLKQDPAEQNNLFHQKPEVVSDLSKKLIRIQAGNYR